MSTTEDKWVFITEEVALVIPVGDQREHTQTTRCWCEPFRRVMQDGKTIIWHRPLDQRYDPTHGLEKAELWKMQRGRQRP